MYFMKNGAQVSKDLYTFWISQSEEMFFRGQKHLYVYKVKLNTDRKIPEMFSIC